MEVKDGNDIVKMYINKEKDIIKGLFILVLDEDGDLVFMKLKGNLTESDLKAIMDSQNN